jgi:hypothetical protein
MMPTRVPLSLARKRSCVAIRIATPSRERSAISSENSLLALGSSPEVGSSSSSASARLATAAIPFTTRSGYGLPGHEETA